MFCKKCQESQKDNQFAKGTKNYKKFALQQHELSEDHLNFIFLLTKNFKID